MAKSKFNRAIQLVTNLKAQGLIWNSKWLDSAAVSFLLGNLV